MQKPILALAGVFVVAVLAGAAWLALTPEEQPAEARSLARLDMGDARLGGPFTLTDQTGRRVSSETVIDGPTLVYFGYTYCPDVCPVDSQVMAEASALLAEQGHAVTPVFITVDPARDTPEALEVFTGYLHPEMIGLTGSAEEIRAVADAYKVYYDKVELEDSAAEYLMNHSAYLYLVEPGQGVTAIFRRGFPPEEIAGEVARILEAGS